MTRARELTIRALEVDPDLPEAHGMLGVVKGQYDYDWVEAERCFQRAVAREPLSPHLRQWYGTFFLCPSAVLRKRCCSSSASSKKIRSARCGE